jgi:2-oxoglutarate dehydrogenase E2 component (dihydrolipoamide succinyltransferase)
MKDDSLAVVESEKTNFELPSPASGRLGRILAQAGQTVKVGATVAQIEPGNEAGQPEAATAPVTQKASTQAAPQAQPSPKAAAPEPLHKPVRPPTPVREQQPPSARPSTPVPAPPEEAPTERAVTEPARPAAPVAEVAPAPELPHAQPRPPAASGREEEVVPMSMLRRTVARRLLEAQRTMAMLTTFNEVDMGAVQALRQQRQEAFQQRYNVKLGLMSFFVKAAVAALKEFPQINAEVRADDIIYRNYFDIGVAIASQQGLVVPVLPNAERLSFAEIETAVADLARRAKERQLKPEELEGGTFTITNGGVFGSLLSTPLINPPQSGILGLHAIVDRPVAREGSVVIRPMMYVALTYDHRIVDGREAVLFLRRIKEVVEDPARMLIEA